MARLSRQAELIACALLAACSRPDGHTSRKPLAAETLHQPLKQARCAGAGEIAVLAHTVELKLDLAAPALAGTGEVSIQALSAASSVALDTPGLVIFEASREGQPLTFEARAGVTCFELAQPLAAGEELTLSLAWQVDPHATGMTFAADQVWGGLPTGVWLPTKLDPSQRAILKLDMTVPDGVEVVVSHSQVSFARWLRERPHAKFEIDTPSSPYLYAFAAGRYQKSVYSGQGFSLSAFGPPDVDLLGVLERTLPIYQFLRQQTGTAIRHGYTQVFVHGEAAQAGVGMSLLPEHVARELGMDANAEAILGQQLARQWFGVLVYCADPADQWLNDGFAKFMMGAFMEQTQGPFAYERERTSWRVTHERGALMLDFLRGELGDNTFWKGIRRYVASQSWKPTRPEDLRNALTAASGRDLAAFFEP